MPAARRLQQLGAALTPALRPAGAAPAPAKDHDVVSHAEAHRRNLTLLTAAASPAGELWRRAPALALSAQQLEFFATFGFLALPGLLADRAAQIVDDFEAVWKVMQSRVPLECLDYNRAVFFNRLCLNAVKPSARDFSVG
jgi:hypothetical protein